MSEPSAEFAMRCHYEVMEVSMTCSVDEIKKQYKKLALRWHPDRNHGQEELATKNFKELAAAYAVLSDIQDRKWYDDHREAILRGGDGTSGGKDEDGDNMINLWKYFNSSCYSGPDDGPTGFFTIYNNVFQSIHKQELDHIAVSTKGASEQQPPSLGTAATESAEFIQFYTYWENFVTKLSFSWEDKYNVTEAPNRQTRRAMEKENLKFRETAKKEFTGQVRSLAAHVKRRDVRYQDLEEAARQKKIEEEERKAALRSEEAQRRRDARDARLASEQYTPEELLQREEERKGAFLLADNDSDLEDENDEGGEAEDVDEFYTDAELRKIIEELKLKEDEDKRNSATGATEKKGRKGKKGRKVASNSTKSPAQRQAPYAASALNEDSDDSSGDVPDSKLPVPVCEQNQPDANPAECSVSDDDASGDASFDCEICSKQFKSEAQLTQHLASKVHRKKAQEQLKKVKLGNKSGGSGQKSGDVVV